MLPVKDISKHQEQNLDVRVIAIGTVPERMIFDKELITVQAGKPVEFRFSNTDAMPHNFAITQPGALEEVGELGEAGVAALNFGGGEPLLRDDFFPIAKYSCDQGLYTTISTNGTGIHRRAGGTLGE